MDWPMSTVHPRGESATKGHHRSPALFIRTSRNNVLSMPATGLPPLLSSPLFPFPLSKTSPMNFYIISSCTRIVRTNLSFVRSFVRRPIFVRFVRYVEISKRSSKEEEEEEEDERTDGGDEDSRSSIGTSSKDRSWRTREGGRDETRRDGDARWRAKWGWGWSEEGGTTASEAKRGPRQRGASAGARKHSDRVSCFLIYGGNNGPPRNKRRKTSYLFRSIVSQ